MEKKNKSETRWLGAGLLAAITASLCCIAPVLAVLGGLGGIATTLTFLEPLRPYLIAVTVLVLGYAFNKAYKPKEHGDVDCACDEEGNPIRKSPLSTKGFLWSVTGLSVIMFAFPSYSHIFFPDSATDRPVVNQENIEHVRLYIDGMTCSSCEKAVDYTLQTEPGVISASASYESASAEVEFDKSKVDPQTLLKAVEEKVGYKGVGYEIINRNGAQ